MLASRSLALAPPGLLLGLLPALLLACGSDAGGPELSERREPDPTPSVAAPTALAPVAGDAARASSTSVPGHAGGDVAVTVDDASGANVGVEPLLEREVEVTAVLVDEGGAPLEGLRVVVRPFDDDVEHLSLGPSDAAGRIAKGVPHARLEAIDDPDVELVQQGLDGSLDPQARRARMEFPSLGGASRLDLGTITMARPPILVAGRIVRADGSPVRGAEFGVDVPPLDGVEFDVSDAWYEATLRAAATSDEGGRFEVRAYTFGLPRWPGTLDLEVGLPGAPNVLKVPFEVGRTDVDVWIESPGTLEVDLSRHSEPVWAQLSVSVTPDLETARATGKLSSEFDAESPEFEGFSPAFIAAMDTGPTIERIAAASRGGGVWAFTPAAGTYSVEVALGGTVVARIDDVLVRAGEPVDDPRLERVDFLFPLEPRVLTVLADEEPVRGARLAYKGANGHRWWDSLAGLLSDAPPTALVAPGGEVLVAVRARGFVPVTINDLPAGEPVTLERPVAVTLEFGVPRGTGADWSGKLALEPTDASSAWELDSAIVLDRLPATAEVELPPGAELRVASNGSPWEGRTFVVPHSGGTVVLEAE